MMVFLGKAYEMLKTLKAKEEQTTCGNIT